MAADSTDVILYSGPVNALGYRALCEALEKKQSDAAMLVLATPGGDPHAGFRIARALQHAYGQFEALVPRYCKSAGTLILIGAKTLYLDDMSELGPLDVQVKKGDELIGRNSGLDIFQAVNFLQNQSMEAFRTYLLELTRDAGLSTRVASDIACKLAIGLFEPIAAQIDPIKLAEMQRATEIAFEYGNRLNEKGGNLRSIGLQKLVAGYPSHGFVIDRKEAKSIFVNVKRPEQGLAELSKALHAEMEKYIDGQAPNVHLATLRILGKELTNDNPPDAEDGAGSSASSQSAVGGDSTGSEAATEAAPNTPVNGSANGAAGQQPAAGPT
jgi:Serine dehydrogenase proteinase